MKATADIQVIPIGSGVSVRKEVMRAHAVLEASDLLVGLHPNGSNVEGELREIMDAVERIHETLHSEGTARIATYLKIGTRTDKEPSLAGKMFK
jgi:uncharacterized protein (TIGR00106 family)